MSNIHLHIIGSESFCNLLTELDFNYSISYDKNITNNNKKDPIVRIIFVEKLQLKEIKKYILENVPTIFLFNDRNFLIKNKLNLLEFHVSLLVPIEILSFREILNILLTKYNFFKKSKKILDGVTIQKVNFIINLSGFPLKEVMRSCTEQIVYMIF